MRPSWTGLEDGDAVGVLVLQAKAQQAQQRKACFKRPIDMHVG
jgi:hypothetical protein